MGFSLSRFQRKRISFRQQLFLIFAAFGLLVAIGAAVAYAWSSTIYLRDLYMEQALRATENFAEQSQLALLYESGENAEDAASATLSFPSVELVMLVSADNTVLLTEGDWSGKQFEFNGQTPKVETAELLIEQSSAWHFWAPVYTDTADLSAFGGSSETGKEYLGFVYVVQDQSDYIATEYEIFRTNLIIGLLGGMVFILALHVLLNKLLAPMNRLVGVMKTAREGETSARANYDGPAEIVNMAEVYNNVMDNLSERDEELRHQKDILESEVSIRTQELVQARDEAVDASRHKSEFLANMSHELRTPLQAIMGYADIVREAMEDECLDEFVEDIDRVTHNATHLLTLINSILDLSKIEAGKMDLRLSPTRVADVVKRTEETVLPLMKQNRNELQIDIDDPGKIVELDETKLFQILLNLTSNAGKFTKNGIVAIKVRHSDDVLGIAVQDTGIGMDKEHLKMIFDPFRQVDGSTTREFEGTGLGLSITRRFTEVMGGRINVKSEKGKGSAFTLRFPLPIKNSADKTV